MPGTNTLVLRQRERQRKRGAEREREADRERQTQRERMSCWITSLERVRKKDKKSIQ